MKKLLSLIFFGMALSSYVLAQENRTISGRVTDQQNGISLPGASAVLLNPADSSLIRGTTTDAEGEFLFTAVAPNSYLLRLSFIGYHPVYLTADASESSVALGDVNLQISSVALQTYTVEESIHQSTQMGDTTQFNAGAFKVNPDANTEDLIQKMAGITILDGQIQAQGEDVKRVTVDGKTFFGEDAKATLRNMPAEAVDKIQVFDYRSDQSQFTGFDDGEEGKTVNIVTKPEFRNGTFGRVYAAYGDAGRYKAGGNVNFFNDARRITLLFQTNNVNEQNFAADDLSGVAGASGRGRGRGGRGGGTGNFSVGARDGIANTVAGGINFTDEWGKNTKINASYFFNRSDRTVLNTRFREFVLDDSDGLVYEESEELHELNNQHRFNLRLEHDIDSMNSIIFTPQVNYNTSSGNSLMFGANLDDTGLLNTTDRRFETTYESLNFSAPLLFQHKFKLPRRTISVQLTPSYSTENGESWLISENRFFEDSLYVDSLDQEGTLDAAGYRLGSSVSYTEPMGEKGMLQLNWRANYNYDDSRNETFSFNPATDAYDLRDSVLNNVFENTYHTQQLGTEYRHNWEKLQISLGLSYQWAELSTDQQFPVEISGLQNFRALLPNARITYKFTDKKNLRVFYRARNNPPSIRQLQNVVDNSNPVRLSIGNPDLKQDYRHSMFMRYSASNVEKSTTFFVGGGFSYTDNYIGNSTIVANTDTMLSSGVFLPRGGQLVMPVNLDGQLSLRSFASYGIPVGLLKSNLNLDMSFRYSRTPGLINGELNTAETPAAGFGVTLGSNISEKVDFTISSNTSYNWVFNTLQNNLNDRYLNQSTRINADFILWKGLVFSISANHKYFSGLSEGFNQNFVLLNSGLGYKFLKNNQAELRLQAYDLLGANTSVQRNVTDVYIEDADTNVLQRYFMLTFTYNLRDFRSNR